MALMNSLTGHCHHLSVHGMEASECAPIVDLPAVRITSDTFFPRSVKAIARSPVSQPFGFTSTGVPIARAIIWCPYYMSTSLTFG